MWYECITPFHGQMMFMGHICVPTPMQDTWAVATSRTAMCMSLSEAPLCA
jgi:hypothetical protein